MLDADLDFPVQVKITGKALFELVCKTVGLRESWYFGLQYKDANGTAWWLRMGEKVLGQITDKDGHLRLLRLLVQFYPEDVEEELIQEMTQHLFFLQVKEAILNEDIFCPAEASVLLASFALQAKYGDFEERSDQLESLAEEQWLPTRVTSQYQLTTEMWEEKIVKWYATHHGMSRFEAEIEYLKIAQDLEMFAINYFPIKNANQTQLWIGIQPTGISVYNQDNKLTPVVSFIWSEIKNISFKNKKFWLDPEDKGSASFVFYSASPQTNRQILDLSVTNHDLYLRRRRSDTMEVQHMKAQAREEKIRREKERMRYIREREAREAACRENEQMRIRLEEYRTELESYREAMERSEETTSLLAEKARVAEEESGLLLRKAADLEKEILRLNLVMSEKDAHGAMLIGKIREHEMMIRAVLDQSETSMRNAESLKEELGRARHSERLAKERLVQLTSNPNLIPLVRQQVTMNGAPSSRDMGSQQNVLHLSREMQQERIAYLQKSSDLQKQLTELKSQIEGLKVAGKQDILEMMHRENVEKGESKYATLKKVTEGSAGARIEIFERL